MIAYVRDYPLSDVEPIPEDCRWTALPTHLRPKPLFFEELTNSERLVGPPFAVLHFRQHVNEVCLRQ
jgi:hypothetical protein